MSDQPQAGGSGAGSTARCGEPAHGSGDRACRNFVAHGATHCRAHSGTPHDLRAELEAARAEITNYKQVMDTLSKDRDWCNNHHCGTQHLMDARGDLAQVRARISELEHNHAECARTADLERAVVDAAREVLVATSSHDDRRAWQLIKDALAALDAATATKGADA